MKSIRLVVIYLTEFIYKGVSRITDVIRSAKGN